MERAVYRIIDANFNRAREAARVMEEFCRFSLNCRLLSSRAKQIRHQLCATIEKLDINKLVVSRDAAGDVGKTVRVEGQLKRTNLRDCFIAAAKRLTEALRALAETTQIIDPTAAAIFEKLRFEVYTLEKDAIILAGGSEKFGNVRLYVLINVTPALGDEEIVVLAKDCAAGGADCLQLRPKDIADDRIFALAVRLVEICKEAGIVSIINDRVDIAAAAGADGVHLGQNDMPIEQGRKLQLSPLIFGLSTHSTNQLNNAIEQLPDYVGIGPVFSTGTKPEAGVAGLEYVSAATKLLRDTGVAHTAIGGITLQNIEQVLEAGAKTVAVCSAAANASDRRAMCSQLKDKIVGFS